MGQCRWDSCVSGTSRTIVMAPETKHNIHSAFCREEPYVTKTLDPAEMVAHWFSPRCKYQTKQACRGLKQWSLYFQEFADMLHSNVMLCIMCDICDTCQSESTYLWYEIVIQLFQTHRMGTSCSTVTLYPRDQHVNDANTCDTITNSIKECQAQVGKGWRSYMSGK